MSTTKKLGIYLNVDNCEIARKEYIRKLFTEGNEKVEKGCRSDIVRYLNETFKDQKVIFQQVYQATSDLNASTSVTNRNLKMLVTKDGNEVSRRDIIKKLFASGNSRSAIVKILKEEYNESVSFQIVYQATS